MKKESFTLFMKQVAVDLQQSGNLGTAHSYFSGFRSFVVSGNHSGVAEAF